MSALFAHLMAQTALESAIAGRLVFLLLVS
jgi:hypothetical protein